MSLEARVEEQIQRYSQHKSHNAAIVVKVRFFNLCKDPIKIWWLDYEGEKVEYFRDVTIVPGHRLIATFKKLTLNALDVV